jgi:hypothetical protein
LEGERRHVSQPAHPPRSHRGFEFLIGGLFTVGIVALALEWTALNNTFSMPLLIADALLAAALLFTALKRSIPWTKYVEESLVWSTQLSMSVGLATLLTALASYGNRAAPVEQVVSEVRVLAKEHLPEGRKSLEQWRVLIRMHDAQRWIRIQGAQWQSLVVGRSYSVATGKGRLGFAFVDTQAQFHGLDAAAP